MTHGPQYYIKREAVGLILCSPAFAIYPLSTKHKKRSRFQDFLIDALLYTKPKRIKRISKNLVCLVFAGCMLCSYMIR